MHDKSNRRLLDVDIPAQPDVLVKLSLLLAEDEVDLNAASLLISSDMALAAAVLKAVNSAIRESIHVALHQLFHVHCCCNLHIFHS